jgi:hypothetical protein
MVNQMSGENVISYKKRLEMNFVMFMWMIKMCCSCRFIPLLEDVLISEESKGIFLVTIHVY